MKYKRGEQNSYVYIIYIYIIIYIFLYTFYEKEAIDVLFLCFSSIIAQKSIEDNIVTQYHTFDDDDKKFEAFKKLKTMYVSEKHHLWAKMVLVQLNILHKKYLLYRIAMFHLSHYKFTSYIK